MRGAVVGEAVVEEVLAVVGDDQNHGVREVDPRDQVAQPGVLVGEGAVVVIADVLEIGVRERDGVLPR